MAATITNNKPVRKQLSHELDRLDGVIDLLADALPGAIADAARDGVRQAVRDAINEALAGPELRSLIAQVQPPAPAAKVEVAAAPAGPTKLERLKSALAALRRRAESAALSLATLAAAKLLACKPAFESAANSVASVWRARHAVVAAAAFGLLTAAACYLAPRAASAVVGGMGGAALTLAARQRRGRGHARRADLA